MSLRRQKPKDSLDLLLDTMCNTFGGIILIAILVALLSGNRIQMTPRAVSADVVQMRADASEELERLKTVNSALERRIVVEGLQRKVELLREMEELRSQAGSMREKLGVQDADLKQLETMAPKEQVAGLDVRLESLREQLQEVLTIGDGLHRQWVAKRKTMTLLQDQLRSTVEGSVLRLRYPREHETSKLRLYVLVKFGRLYPLERSSGDRNELTIDWSEIGDSSIAAPRKGRGLDPVRDVDQTRAFFSGIDVRTRYVAFIVFQDSFAEFRLAQRYCAARDLEYGWMARLQSADAAFSRTGSNPLPQ